jgi:signal transduction histidine kinase/CheY-like chemotaxis protein
MKKKYIITLLILCIHFFGYSQYSINSKTQIEEVSLHKYAQIYDSKDSSLTANQVFNLPNSYFKDLPNANTDLGFTQSSYWIKFQIKNELQKEVLYYLETSRPIVDVATFYKINTSGKITTQKSGDFIPFNERTLQQRKTVFNLVLAPNENATFLINLKSDGEVINAPVILRSAENLIEVISFEQIVFGFFYGILLIASILYFFFYFAMKERVFLYYSIYVVFIGLLQFSLDGYFYEFITPQSGWFSHKSVLLFAVISGFFLAKYSKTFLKVDKEFKFLHLFYRLLYVCFGGLMLVILFVPQWFHFGYPAMNLIGLLLLFSIIASLVSVYKRYKTINYFFAIGVFFLIVGFVVFILKNFGLLPYNFITENSSKLGTGLEVIFLSLSMANFVKQLRDDREKLQVIALERSEEMNELKSYFLSNISHELRTPLNTIMNLTEMINSETDADSIHKKCEIIKYSSQNLLSSVNDILDFSKIEKNELILENVEFDSKQLFSEIHKTFKGRAEEKNLQFQFNQNITVPKLIKGDPNRLRQIITNILQNAIKFTDDGVVKFLIDVKSSSEKEVILEFKISDSGNGISKEKLHTIFESFSQQSINNKRKYGGLGLGLFIVKAIIEKANGIITIDSLPNQGTVCTFSIPFEAVSQEEEKVVNNVVTYDLLGKRILVVEDNAMNQMVIKMILKKWHNTEFDIANNGEESLAWLEKHKYDAILMDLQMPVMDGYEATIAIRSGGCGMNTKDIPIIAVTADVMESTKKRVLEIGMNDYLSKPIEKELLFKTVLKCID